MSTTLDAQFADLNERALPASTATSRSVYVGQALLFAVVTVTTMDLVIADYELGFSTDWQTLLRLALCGACGIYGLFHNRQSLGVLSHFPVIWLTLFGVWALLTIPMGIAPLYSLASVASLACVIVFVPAVLSVLGGRRVVYTVTIAMVSFVAVSWLLYFLVPKLGRSPFEMPDGSIIYRLGGDAQQLGFQATWGVGLLLILGFSRIERWQRLILPLALCGLTIPLTQSRTAMLACLAVVMVIVARQFSTRLLLSFACLVGVVGGLFLMAQGGDLSIASADRLAAKVSRSGKPDEIYNLTGRTEIWDNASRAIGDSPVLGWGYGAARQIMSSDKYARSTEFQTVHAHNLWLNITLCSGLIGLTLMAAMTLGLGYRALTQPNPIPDMILVFVLVAGITEPVLFGPMPRAHTVLWVLALCWRPMNATLEKPSPALANPVSAFDPYD